jgi:hypothetical protein
MKYPIRVLGQMGLTGNIMVNNADYTSIVFGEGRTSSLEFDMDTDDMVDEDISDIMQEPLWFLNLIFEEIEDIVEIYED